MGNTVKLISNEDEPAAAVRSILANPGGEDVKVEKKGDRMISVGEEGATGQRAPIPDLVLQKSAEDILAGVERQAPGEVQYLAQGKEGECRRWFQIV